jgi:hypothetical protein
MLNSLLPGYGTLMLPFLRLRAEVSPEERILPKVGAVCLASLQGG